MVYSNRSTVLMFGLLNSFILPSKSSLHGDLHVFLAERLYRLLAPFFLLLTLSDVNTGLRATMEVHTRIMIATSTINILARKNQTIGVHCCCCCAVVMENTLPAPLLPEVLEEPMIFLSVSQNIVLQQRPPLNEALKGYFLPAWVPHRIVANALGYGQAGIKNAIGSLNGLPYVWATEFENVHDLWYYDEPTFEMDGHKYQGSEHFYHSQKPVPFDAKVWNRERDSAMEKAIRTKLHAAGPSLRLLLQATRGHPLLSVKNDEYWGFHPQWGGCNKLASIWMKLRDELCAEVK